MSSSSKIVGLTGGIGSGKTTVLRAFKELGVPCFVADIEAKKCYQNPTFLNQIAQHFGNGILIDGKLNNKALANIVFSNEAELTWLNNQIHPKVDLIFNEWHARQTAPYVLYESAILYEAGLDKKMDYVVTVYLELEERIQRIQLRDTSSREDILARIKNQYPAEQALGKADFVVLNYEGNPRERQVKYIDNLIKQHIASHPYETNHRYSSMPSLSLCNSSE